MPTPLAPATSFSQLSPIIKESRTSDCVAERANENFGPGLQDTDVIRENNLLKKWSMPAERIL